MMSQDVLAACPPFRIEIDGQGDVGVLMAGEYVHTWSIAELREVRDG